MAGPDTERAEAERHHLQEENKRLWDHLIKLREWKERLEGENSESQAETSRLQTENQNLRAETTQLQTETARAKTETAELRLQTTVLQAQNDELTASARSAHAEVVELERRLESMSQANIALRKQAPGPVPIPMEVLTCIAGFLAGGNCFGTLMNFSIMNKRIRQECLPICYETIITSDTNDWAMRLKRAILGDHRPLEWQWCRFVYLPSWTRDHGSAARCFPNVRVSFAWDRLSRREMVSPHSTGETHFRARLVIHKPVPVTLLALLIQCPQRWSWRDCAGNISHAAEEVPRSIRGIGEITFEKGGVLVQSGDRKDYSVLKKNRVTRLNITWKSSSQGKEACDTFRALESFAPTCTDGSMAKDYPVTTLVIGDGPGIDAWAKALPFTLPCQPRVLYTVELGGIVEFARFKQCMLSVAKAYVQVWRQIEDRMDRFGEEHVTFMTVKHKYYVEEETVDMRRRWEGWLFMHPGHTTAKPFTLAIMEFLNSDDQNYQLCVFQKLCSVPKKRK